MTAATARILIIEDDATSMELMAYLLEAFGHTIMRACDGLEGLEAFCSAASAGALDLVICDIQLPGATGYEVARQVKADRRLRHIPLVAVTALAMVGDRDKVLAAGFDGYIAKPITPETFVGQVEAFLAVRPPAAAPAAAPAPAARAVPAAAAATPHAPQAPPHAQPGAQRRATILIVDDSPDNLSFLSSLLEAHGYQVASAGEVAKALSLTRQGVPDLVICDFHLWKEDGRDLLKAIKADPSICRTPFVFLSSTAWQTKDHADGLALGAVRFITRPIEPEALLAHLQACLAEAQARRAQPPEQQHQQPPDSTRG